MISYEIYSAHVFFLFFFNDTATTEIYTLSLHDALPILKSEREQARKNIAENRKAFHDYHIVETFEAGMEIGKPRLNSSHSQISYAVFCLKKKKKKKKNHTTTKTLN